MYYFSQYLPKSAQNGLTEAPKNTMSFCVLKSIWSNQKSDQNPPPLEKILHPPRSPNVLELSGLIQSSASNLKSVLIFGGD